MHVLVTGAGGFLARYLLPLLVPNHQVVGVLRPGADRPQGLPDGITWLERDLTAGTWVLPFGVDAVVHLAQSRHDREFPARADDLFAVNVAGTFHLMEAARRAGVRVFVFASSAGIYGHAPSPVAEDAPPCPRNFYHVTKHIVEQMLCQYRGFFPAVILRLFFPFGAGQRGRFLAQLFARVAAGEPLRLAGPDGIRLNPIHASDVARALVAALGMTTGPEVVNVAGDETTTIRALGEAIGRIVGRAPVFRPEDGAGTGDLVGDNRRLKSLLKVEPRVGLAEGLAGMWPAGGAR